MSVHFSLGGRPRGRGFSSIFNRSAICSVHSGSPEWSAAPERAAYGHQLGFTLHGAHLGSPSPPTFRIGLSAGNPGVRPGTLGSDRVSREPWDQTVFWNPRGTLWNPEPWGQTGFRVFSREPWEPWGQTEEPWGQTGFRVQVSR